MPTHRSRLHLTDVSCGRVIVAWNTVYAQEALKALRESGQGVSGRDLSHLSLTLHEHVNPYGRYRFDPEAAIPGGGILRPLRRT